MKSLRRNQGAGEENTWEVGFPACAPSGICDMEVRFTSTYRPPQGIVHKNFLFVSMLVLAIILHRKCKWAVGCLAIWVTFGKSKLFNATPLLSLL